MSLWHFLVAQDVPGIVLGSVVSALICGIPIVKIWHRVSERRHKERLAATHALTAALNRKP